MSNHEVALTVATHSPADVVKVVEVLSRTLAGLGLDGFSAVLAVEPEGFYDEEDDEDASCTYNGGE